MKKGIGWMLGALLGVSVGVAAQEAPRNRVTQGGGVIYPAWTGSYFSNAEFSGEPAYTRSDVRVRFDWEDWRPILGVYEESVKNFPRENISIRWRAKMIARFDEEYTFKLLSDEQARFKIRPEGAGEWTTLIDAWKPHTRRADTARMKLRPGTVYEVEIDYANLRGDAVCSLLWSSPSTPEEVVDYASASSVKDHFPQMHADLNQFTGKAPFGVFPASSANLKGGKVDENGWHTEDFSYALLEGYAHYGGRGRIRFTGQANVQISGATFEVDGKPYATLPKGVGYHRETNRTEADVLFAPGPDGLLKSVLSMTLTQREPDGPSNTGVTDLSIMLPTQAGGNIPHEPGAVVSQEARDALLPVYVWRYQTTGLNDIVKWSERTLPTYSRMMGQIWRADTAYEKLILAANETGRDLHLCFGGSIDEEFMRNLALLFKYGSDGKNPYTKPTPNPVWPPLSPNLRLYLEHGNEMGWSAIQPREWSKDYDRLRESRDPIYTEILNFDGAADQTAFDGVMRYHAYRTLRMSENMRAVWGDPAMGETIRVCLFGQYERYFQNGMMQFVDDYYNNPKYVKDPHPVSHFFWAAGPAVYYGTTDMFCSDTPDILTNGSFEQAEVAPGTAKVAPSVAGWIFEGGAGVADCRTERHEAFKADAGGGPVSIASGSAVGFRFTVGDRDLYAYEVGRTVQAGESGLASVVIYTDEGKAVVNQRVPRFELKGRTPGEMFFAPLENDGWITPDSSRVGVWRLEAGRSYVLLTQPAAGQIPGPAALKSGPGLTIDGAVTVKSAGLNGNGLSGKIEVVDGPGTGFVAATFRYAFAQAPQSGMVIAPSDPLLDSTWLQGGKGKSGVPPSHRAGTKAAFLAGRGRISQTFVVEKAGDYALIFTANSGLVGAGQADRAGNNPLTIRIDEESVWTRDTVGSGRKPKGGVFQWGTRYVRLEPGRHTLTIESHADDPAATVYLYAMHLGEMSDFAGGETAAKFLGAGAATGQTDAEFLRNAKLCTAMAFNWGLVPYAYEGGTNAGGDWGGEKLLYAHQFKWEHQLSRVADNNWARCWHKYGGANAMYYYEGFEPKYHFRAEEYAPWAAAIDRAHGWELEPTGPEAAPIRFTPQTLHYQSDRGSTWKNWYHPYLSNMSGYQKDVGPTLAREGQWKGFIFRAPQAGMYTVTATTTEGGEAVLLVNDSQAIVSGPSGQPLKTRVFLTKGVHSVKLKNGNGSFDLVSIEVN
jgi:hypothetical protein